MTISMSKHSDIPYRLHKSVNDLRHQNNKGYFFAMPKGHHVTLWFTRKNNKCVCIEKGKKNTTVVQCSFNKKLCFDTIVSAVKFKYKNKWFYAVHDVLKYRGQPLSVFSLPHLEEVFKNIQNISDFIIFGVPLYNKMLDTLLKTIQDLSYDIYAIEYRFRDNPILIKKHVANKRLFLVKPELTQDIYSLYDKNRFHSYALIPNIKTSTMMNNIFRDIKECNDIDLIEESEDEDDFEDTKEHRFIKEQEKQMECVYNEKFKLWVPSRLI